ncbi:MAG: flagellar basal-body rod protein FlgG [Verrucomicrobium sp.]|nr:flagellar basal-body rod protein FlgG [Verrucomicrobium sp.]
MIRSLYSAASGMQAQQTNIDVISNNLANVNTPGFKGSSAQFEDLLYDVEKQPGAILGNGSNTPGSLSVGYGTKLVATNMDMTQGEMVQQSGSQLSLAIQGNGFFQVQLADGSGLNAYTRNGSFQVNQSGQIVTNDGLVLVGAPQVPQGVTQISVSQDGTFTFQVNGQTQNGGQVQLTQFINPQGLDNHLGGGLFLQTTASGPQLQGKPMTNGLGSIQQGYIENSNVQVVTQMVQMIQAQRAYEVNAKSIQAADQMMQQADNLRQS